MQNLRLDSPKSFSRLISLNQAQAYYIAHLEEISLGHFIKHLVSRGRKRTLQHQSAVHMGGVRGIPRNTQLIL